MNTATIPNSSIISGTPHASIMYALPISKSLMNDIAYVRGKKKKGFSDQNHRSGALQCFLALL
jgi:hypothetical protein